MKHIDKLRGAMVEHVSNRKKIKVVVISRQFYEAMFREHDRAAEIIRRHVRVQIHEELDEDFIIL